MGRKLDLNPEWLQKKEKEEQLAAEKQALEEASKPVEPQPPEEPVQEPTPEEVVQAAKDEAAKPESESAEAGPLASVPVPTRELAGGLMRYLVATGDDFRMLVGTMIAARQLYAVAVRDMEYRVARLTKTQRELFVAQVIEIETRRAAKQKEEADAKGISYEEARILTSDLREADPAMAWDLVEEFMMAASANAAAQPFTEDTLKTGMTESVMPWLEKVTALHNKWAAEDRKKAIDEWEEARRQRPIPLSFKWDEIEGTDLPRARSLVLYGWAPALHWLMDNLVTGILADRAEGQPFMVLRLMRQHGKVETQTRLFRLGGKDWEDCCRSGRSWFAVFTEKVMPHISEPPDVLICDDLTHAGKSAGLLVGSGPRKAGAAHRRFRQWCDKAGCAFVGCLPLEDKSIDFPATPDWEQLRVFTALRGVAVEEEDDKYKLTVGNDLAVLRVETSFSRSSDRKTARAAATTTSLCG